jgi:hypothetical protein
MVTNPVRHHKRGHALLLNGALFVRPVDEPCRDRRTPAGTGDVSRNGAKKDGEKIADSTKRPLVNWALLTESDSGIV